MKIDNKEFLNPQQQLYQNTKDIEKLKADYQPVYNYNGLIGSTEIHTVNISSTNAPVGTKNGWLMDYTGKLFKITDGSTTTLLIDYYAAIKGPKGDTGDTGIGIYMVSSNLNPLTGFYTNVNTSDIDTNRTIQVKDLLIGTNDILGQITTISGNTCQVLTITNLKGDRGEQGPQGQATIGIQVVEELPASGTEGVIYLVPAEDPETGNAYDEYIYTNSAWEKFGYVNIDLTNYALKSEIPVINENLIPKTHYTYDLGASGLTYKDLWVGNIKNLYLDVSTAGVGGTQGNANGSAIIKTKSGNGTVQSTLTIDNLGYSFSNTIYPKTTETIDLGKLNAKFKDLYLSGSLKDGTNSIAISDIATESYVDSQLPNIAVGNEGEAAVENQANIWYTSTAPQSNPMDQMNIVDQSNITWTNASIVVTSTEPANYYPGRIYFITEA